MPRKVEAAAWSTLNAHSKSRELLAKPKPSPIRQDEKKSSGTAGVEPGLNQGALSPHYKIVPLSSGHVDKFSQEIKDTMIGVVRGNLLKETSSNNPRSSF